MKSLKLNKEEILASIFMFIVGGAIIIFLGSFLDKLNLENYILLRIVGYIIGGIMVCIPLLSTMFADSEIFYEYIYMPIEEIEVRRYKNLIVFAMDGQARYYTDKIEELAELKEMKIVLNYNRRKVLVSADLLPLTTLKEAKKKKKNAPVAQR